MAEPQTALDILRDPAAWSLGDPSLIVLHGDEPFLSLHLLGLLKERLCPDEADRAWAWREFAGDEEIDAEKVRHYRVNVPFADALESNPSLGDMFDQFDADMPDVIEYDVWVAKDNRIRRLVWFETIGRKA